MVSILVCALTQQCIFIKHAVDAKNRAPALLQSLWLPLVAIGFYFFIKEALSAMASYTLIGTFNLQYFSVCIHYGVFGLARSFWRPRLTTLVLQLIFGLKKGFLL